MMKKPTPPKMPAQAGPSNADLVNLMQQTIITQIHVKDEQGAINPQLTLKMQTRMISLLEKLK